MFSGPTIFRVDLAIRKSTKIRERHSIDFGLDAYNALNHPVWFFSNTNINSTSFGRISDQYFPSRIVRVQLEYRF